ncbi:hypothetical protein ACSBL2_06140 [Pedobacter sp. AW31-3R]|uniref:hypothetical protein n=1 Tax=Pedobacter sp. AW31-3R TaxID=3445781 RepID=UPI003F9F3451
MLIKQTIDFIATLKYNSTAEGGRSTPAFSGYRPNIKFPFDEMHTSGEQRFIGTNCVFPGDTVDAEIRIIAIDHFNHLLYPGLSFEFKEGARIIGTGMIIRILNKNLMKLS